MSTIGAWTLRARVLSAAERLADEGCAIALLDGDGWDDGNGGLTLAVEPREEIRVAIDEASLTIVARAIDEAARNGRWHGYVSYEAAREIERARWSKNAGVAEPRPKPVGEALVLRRFAAEIRVDSRGAVTTSGSGSIAHARLLDAMESVEATPIEPLVRALTPVDDDDAHRHRVRSVLEAIARGDLYQACIARRFAGSLASLTRRGARSPNLGHLYRALIARGPARFGAALDFGDHAIASMSPELFLDVRGDSNADVQRDARDGERLVRTSPIKGTRPRSRDPRVDAARARELDADEKERAELAMVVDLERNDLGRICRIGGVHVEGDARIESSATVHHRVHDVVGELRDDVTLGHAFATMFPSGSVTGAPKVRAMELIADMERDRRGIYCGAIVTIDGGAAPTLRASMAIRTLVVDANNGAVSWDSGGGIVEASDANREVAETWWKAASVAEPPGEGPQKRLSAESSTAEVAARSSAKRG